MRPSISIPLTAFMAIAASTVAGAAEPAASSNPVAPATEAKPSTTPAPQKIMTAEAPPSAPVAFESMEANGQKFVLVCSIKAVEANRQFQQNVSVVQNQLAQAKELRKRIEQALTTVEKEALTKVLADTEKSLEQNNTIMAKTYGFSILRQYISEVGKTRLYTPITEAEYEKAKAEKDFKADHYIVNENGKFAHVATIAGVAENNIFRQNVQLVQSQRDRLVQLKNAIEQTKDADAKKKLEDEFKKSEETLLKNNEEMTKSYGFSLVRNYVIEIEESKLFMSVTEEEFAKQKAESEKSGAKAPAAAPAAAGAAK